MSWYALVTKKMIPIIQEQNQNLSDSGKQYIVEQITNIVDTHVPNAARITDTIASTCPLFQTIKTDMSNPKYFIIETALHRPLITINDTYVACAQGMLLPITYFKESFLKTVPTITWQELAPNTRIPDWFNAIVLVLIQLANHNYTTTIMNGNHITLHTITYPSCTLIASAELLKKKEIVDYITTIMAYFEEYTKHTVHKRSCVIDIRFKKQVVVNFR